MCDISLPQDPLTLYSLAWAPFYTFSLVVVGAFSRLTKVPRAAPQQDMGHKILYYKRMGLLFLLKCSITL